MNLYETEFTGKVKFRVRANSEKDAHEIFSEFFRSEGEYIGEEVTLNGECYWTDFEEVHPKMWDEMATISRDEDGRFDAIYEGGDEE